MRGLQPVNPRMARLGWDMALQGRPGGSQDTTARRLLRQHVRCSALPPAGPTSPARAHGDHSAPHHQWAIRPSPHPSLALASPPSPRLASTWGRPSKNDGVTGSWVTPGAWACGCTGQGNSRGRATHTTLAHDSSHTHGLTCPQIAACAATRPRTHHTPTLPLHARPHTHRTQQPQCSTGPAWLPFGPAPWTVQPGGPTAAPRACRDPAPLPYTLRGGPRLPPPQLS